MTTNPDDAERREGLRERKKRETQAKIASAGLALFLERGFEETTLGAIAESADIARRTFFHYFESKEAILATVEAGAEGKLVAALAAQPDDLEPLQAVHAAMQKMVAGYGGDEARALDRLMRSTVTLRIRKQANYLRQERLLLAALEAKWPDLDLRPKLQAVAMVSIGALRLAADAWSADGGGKSLGVHLRDVFAAIRQSIPT